MALKRYQRGSCGALICLLVVACIGPVHRGYDRVSGIQLINSDSMDSLVKHFRGQSFETSFDVTDSRIVYTDCFNRVDSADVPWSKVGMMVVQAGAACTVTVILTHSDGSPIDWLSFVQPVTATGQAYDMMSLFPKRHGYFRYNILIDRLLVSACNVHLLERRQR